MSSKPRQRPLSPYMLGPYYRFEFQTVTSLGFRLSGIFMHVVLTPLACIWMLTLALGPGPFEAMQSFMSGWLGTAIAWVGALAISWHVCGGIRHLVWDSGRMLEMGKIRASGWVAIAAALALFAATLWVAS